MKSAFRMEQSQKDQHGDVCHHRWRNYIQMSSIMKVEDGKAALSAMRTGFQILMSPKVEESWDKWAFDDQQSQPRSAQTVSAGPSTATNTATKSPSLKCRPSRCSTSFRT